METFITVGIIVALIAALLILAASMLLYWSNKRVRTTLLYQGYSYEAMSRTLVKQLFPAPLMNHIAETYKVPELHECHQKELYIKRQERAMKLFYMMNQLKHPHDTTQWIMDEILGEGTLHVEGGPPGQVPRYRKADVMTSGDTPEDEDKDGNKKAFKAADDPNYQTMANLDDQKIFEKAEPAPDAFKAQDDPNYQTLAGIGEEMFDTKPKPEEQALVALPTAKIADDKKQAAPPKEPEKATSTKRKPLQTIVIKPKAEKGSSPPKRAPLNTIVIQPKAAPPKEETKDKPKETPAEEPPIDKKESRRKSGPSKKEPTIEHKDESKDELSKKSKSEHSKEPKIEPSKEPKVEPSKEPKVERSKDSKGQKEEKKAARKTDTTIDGKTPRKPSRVTGSVLRRVPVFKPRHSRETGQGPSQENKDGPKSNPSKETAGGPSQETKDALKPRPPGDTAGGPSQEDKDASKSRPSKETDVPKGKDTADAAEKAAEKK